MDRSGWIRRVVTWLLLAASLAVALAFLVIRATLPSDGARAAFYGGAWSSAGIAISPIDEPAAGLETGDTVASVDGTSLETWVRAATDPSLRRPGSASPIPYGVVRDGARVTAAIAWTPPAMLATLVAGWGVILFSVATAAVAGFVFLRRPDEPAATALVLVAAAAAGSSVPWFLGVTVSDVVNGGPFVLHALVTGPLYMLLWPAGIHLALVFPRAEGRFAARRGTIPAIYGVTLGAYALLTAASAAVSPTALEFVGTWPAIQAAVVVPCVAVALALIVRSYVRTRDPAGRAQVRLATAGAVTSLALGLGLFMLPFLLIGRTLLPDGALGLIALPLPLGMAAGILRNRLFNIDAALNRTLVYGGMTLGVLVTYSVAASVITSVIGAGLGFGASLLATGVAALVALPLRDGLQRGVNRLLYGQRHEPWVAMHRLGQRLAWAADPEGAVPAIAETVRDALRVPYVAVEVDRGQDGPGLVTEVGRRPAEVVSVPLSHGAQGVGRLVLGLRSGERDFHADERRLLEDLARQAGTAIDALALRHDLARSREALVLAREEERRRLRRDLHDGLGPALGAIGMRAETATAFLSTDPAAAEANLEALGDEVRAALADVRRLVDGLRPPALDELGLLGAIRQQAERLESSGPDAAGPTIRVDGPAPDAMPELAAAVEVAAYRITIEALTNAVRHAAAKTCRVRIDARDRLRIEITDDGVGLPADVRPGVGLDSMRVRAAEVGGELRIELRQPHGTRVLANLPLRGGATLGAAG